VNNTCPVRFGAQYTVHTVHTVQRPVVVGVCAWAVCRVHRPDSAQLPTGPTSRNTGDRGPRGGKWWQALANRYFQRHTLIVTAAEAVAVLGRVCLAREKHTESPLLGQKRGFGSGFVSAERPAARPVRK